MATKIEFLKEIKLKNGIMFTGLPGIGLVGKIVIDYLLKEFKPVKIANIYSDSFPPSVHTKKGIIEMISDSLYYYSFNDQDYLFLAGPIQPALDGRASTAEHYEFAEKIVEEVKKIGVAEIYTLAGINVGEKRLAKKPGVICATTSSKLLQDLKKHGIQPEKEEGLISGAAGLLLGVGNKHGLEGACLMGETNARLIYGDPGSAKSMLEIIKSKFGFKVSMEKIEKEAKEIEKTFKQLSQQMQELDKEEESPEDGLSYVR